MGGDYLELGSQIALPLVLRLDLNLTCFEMSYKNIPQKFCVNFLTKCIDGFSILIKKCNNKSYDAKW